MAKERSNSPPLGHKFGRSDVERIGLFSEMAYNSAKTRPKKKAEKEPTNMYGGGRKIKDGTQQGYFEPVFKRIFSKEAIKGRGRKLGPPKFKNVSERPFMPPIGFKQHACPGDHFGTFGGIIEAFSNKRKRKPPYKPEGINMLTNPGKLGGPGYVNICLNSYPEHKADRYGLKPKYKEYGKMVGRAMVPCHYPQPYFSKNPFAEPPDIKSGPTYVRPKSKERPVRPPGYILPTGPGKLQGGCHDGCFDKFPEHKTERHPAKKMKKVPEKIWLPNPRSLKSYYNTSTLFQSVDMKVNNTNYKEYQPVFNKYIYCN